MITLQRSGALGDVILTTPIIRRLRRENPTEIIRIATGYPEVFHGNPHLTMPTVADTPTNWHIMLDLAYEFRPELHIVQAYMLETFGDIGNPDDLGQELFYTRAPVFAHDRYVAVHATVAGWANRTLPRETWRDVVVGLKKAGLWPILVGSPRDDIPDLDVTRFITSDILTLASVIGACACFVGSDSGVLHIAGATEVPIVGVMTCAKPATRMPWRHGQMGWKCTAVVPNLPCTGCLSRRPAPVTSEFCERGDNACVEMVRADDIVAAVVAAVEV